MNLKLSLALQVVNMYTSRHEVFFYIICLSGEII